MQFKVMTHDGFVSAFIEIDRAQLGGGGSEAGWQLSTTRVQEAGFDVLDWRTDDDGIRTLVVGD